MTDAPETRGAAPTPVFVVGCRRSGTTWTMLLLAQHREVVAAQQIDFFRRLAHFGRWFETDERFGMCLLSKEVGQGVRSQESKGGLRRLPLGEVLSREAFDELVRPLARDVYARFASANPGARVVVDQTPEYVQVAEEIQAVFPDARFLHVVRDPRSVFCSHRSAAHSWADATRFSYDPIDVAREWHDDVTRARAIAGWAGERFREVRYEDLRSAPVETLHELYRWIGLESSEEDCLSAVEACSLDQMRDSRHAPRGFFRQGATDGWRKEMSTGEVHCVEYVTGELMRDLGYELESSWPVPKPFSMRLRSVSEGARRSLTSWAWNDQSRLRRGASRVLKAFPGVRKALLNRLKRPA